MPNYPPFEYKDPATDELTGFDVDLGEALAAKLGVKLQWEETGFDQMMSALTTNRVDVILSGMTDLPSRREAVNFLDYVTGGPQFYTVKAFVPASSPSDQDALCGKTVGASRRTSWPDDIVRRGSNEHCVKAGKKPAVQCGAARTARRMHACSCVRGVSTPRCRASETLPYQNSVEQNAYAPIGKPFLSQYNGIGMAKGNTALNAGSDDRAQPAYRRWHVRVLSTEFWYGSVSPPCTAAKRCASRGARWRRARTCR